MAISRNEMAALGANRKLPISLPSFRSAPIPAVRVPTIGRLKSTRSGPPR